MELVFHVVTANLVDLFRGLSNDEKRVASKIYRAIRELCKWSRYSIDYWLMPLRAKTLLALLYSRSDDTWSSLPNGVQFGISKGYRVERFYMDDMLVLIISNNHYSRYREDGSRYQLEFKDNRQERVTYENKDLDFKLEFSNSTNRFKITLSPGWDIDICEEELSWGYKLVLSNEELYVEMFHDRSQIHRIHKDRVVLMDFHGVDETRQIEEFYRRLYVLSEKYGYKYDENQVQLRGTRWWSDLVDSDDD